MHISLRIEIPLVLSHNSTESVIVLILLLISGFRHATADSTHRCMWEGLVGVGQEGGPTVQQGHLWKGLRVWGPVVMLGEHS